MTVPLPNIPISQVTVPNIPQYPHNPKGGLVLLNDGTVKFIRTEEELKQLRWK